MDSENKPKVPEGDFGKVVDALHGEQKLSSLRTYQGDMAQFIRDKDQSVIDIALKEKQKKEQKQREEEEKRSEKEKEEAEAARKAWPKPEKKKEEKKPKRSSTGTGWSLSPNFIIIISSIMLLGGGILAFLYVFDFKIGEEPNGPAITETSIIPVNGSFDLSVVSSQNLKSELPRLSLGNGINMIKLSSPSGLIAKSQELFQALEVPVPNSLGRTLRGDYMLGVTSREQAKNVFLIFTVNDFGLAFSGMLEWESSMLKDLSFLEADFAIATDETASTTTTTTISTATPGALAWKDLIIKNKDTRALVDSSGRAKVSYTFLDKNTILISSGTEIIGDISSAYAARAIVR